MHSYSAKKKVYSHVTEQKWWSENNSQFLYCLTGSILQDQGTVPFWVAQRSAAQNVERIHTGYVANPSNNEKSYLFIDYYFMELRKFVSMDAALWSDFFHKDFVQNFVLFWNPSSKQDCVEKEEKFQEYLHYLNCGINTLVVSWKHHRWMDIYIQRMKRMILNLLTALYTLSNSEIIK